jgi:ACR3 family arsenite efflux pump ArsB
MVVIAGALYFNPFNNEPMWAEWILSSVLVYVGLPLAIVGAAIHFFANPKSEGSNHIPAGTKGHR